MDRITKLQMERIWLLNARIRAHMTQDEVARAVGVSRSAYQKYEYGLRNPNRRKVKRLVEVLNVNEDYFIEKVGSSIH